MNFDKESKFEEFFFVGGGGGGVHSNIMYLLIFCAHVLFKFQVPSSSGSLVLTETKGITDR